MIEVIVKSGFHGKVEVPPMIANVSIRAAGASVANIVDWIVLDDLRKEKLTIFLKQDANDPAHVLVSLIPWFFIFSMIVGILSLK